MDNQSSKRIFIFGLGYVATALASVLKDVGWRVAGTCRSETRRHELLAHGFEAYPFDGEERDDGIGRQVIAADHLLSTIPPEQTGDPALAFYEKQIANAKQSCWIGYLSTTGVYGDWDGEEVNEESPVRPSSVRAHRRVAAECAWLALGRRTGHGVHVFRLAGIYGPSRNILAQVRAGTARRIEKSGHLFSRIHVSDIVSTLCASMTAPRPGAIYNVCDDEPASQSDVVAHAYTLLGMSAPQMTPFDNAVQDMSELARSFWVDNRRVSNRRLYRELGVELAYPTYREGLAALIAAGE